MSAEVAVTGLGCVTCLGPDAEQTFAALTSGRCGLRPLTLFPSIHAGTPVGEIRFAGQPPEPGARTEHLAWLAVLEALGGAGLHPAGVADMAVAAGTTVSGLPGTENYFRLQWAGKKAGLRWLQNHLSGSLSQHVARRLGARGLNATVSTACSSGLNAVALAADWIRSGQARLAVAVGADALSALTINGFHALLIADSQAARPFDAGRRGLSLGEGSGALVLEAAEHARERRAAVLARVLGVGNTCDAHHATAPHPEGRGAEAAMRQALQAAGLKPSDVDYVNAHGTGTVDNDRTESQAISRVFGPEPPPVSSIKGAIGHTLGAAGAIESAVCVQALRQGLLPPTTGCQEPDAGLEIRPLLEARPAHARVVMNNSFGFGGNNACVLFGKG